MYRAIKILTKKRVQNVANYIKL